MKLDGKRLLICEEALISYTGHFYTWIKSIRKINLAAGAQVEVASNTEVEKPIADEFSAHRTYSKNNWSGVYHYTQAWKRYLGVFKHNKLVYTETKRLLKETEPIDCIPHSFKRLRKCTTYYIKRQRVMEISIDFQILTKSELTKTHFRRLKPTCAKSCVPARNPLGHVVIYAPALACRLRLALHHISAF